MTSDHVCGREDILIFFSEVQTSNASTSLPEESNTVTRALSLSCLSHRGVTMTRAEQGPQGGGYTS